MTTRLSRTIQSSLVVELRVLVGLVVCSEYRMALWDAAVAVVAIHAVRAQYRRYGGDPLAPSVAFGCAYLGFLASDLSTCTTPPLSPDSSGVVTLGA